MNNYLVPSYPNRGINFVTGKGIYLVDDKGRKFLDLGSNYGVNIFGYNHPRILGSLKKQLETLINLHGSFNNNTRTLAAEKLTQICGGKLSQVFFSNSGAEAIEAALKFARLATAKSHFIAMNHGYHGKTLGALSATGGDKYRHFFEPLLWQFSHVPFGDIKAVEKNIRQDTSAIIIEPIQGEGGIKLATKIYFRALQKLCQAKNILLIVDEIQTGLGRTGTFLAGQQFGLTPDILCLGKGLAGGIPIGATLVTETIAQAIPLHIHTTTFGGNPLATAGILATLAEINQNLLQHIRSTGKYFLSALKKIKHPKIIEARGIGLMLGLELTENATWLLKALQEKYIIAIPAGSNIVRFLPPYLISKKEVNKAIKIINRIFSISKH
ncbi:aspartate aminotransferase family protein [Candidatus Gottesmanbacteria bacterium]|nr:aspartate aminotransferase family protein [Candidatus Gottesmanbacteria bacterium]